MAINMLARVFGFKNLTKELEAKMILWSNSSADTGMKYPLDENADNYQEAHMFFQKSLEEVRVALKNNDSSKYDLDGVLAIIIKSEVITDIRKMAN